MSILANRIRRLNQRVTVAALLVTLPALVLVAVLLGFVHLNSALGAAREDQRIAMEGFASAVSAALVFEDRATAGELVRAYGGDPDVRRLVVISREYGELARYERKGSIGQAEKIMTVVQVKGEVVGQIECYAQYDRIARSLLEAYLVAGPIVLVLGGALAWFVASMVRNRVAGPFERLAGFARSVVAIPEVGAAPLRAPRPAVDAAPELVDFTAALDAMLARIGTQDGELRASAEQLAQRLAELERLLAENQRMTEERLTMERSMQAAQRLESLGVLAGGIAHDFNNLLTVVLAHASMGREYSDLGEARESFGQIEMAARRAADLCRQMLAYAGRGKMQVTAIELSGFVRELTGLLEVSAGKKARLELELAANLPLVRVDPVQLQQIIMNLTMNASEAMKEGQRDGRVRLSTARHNLSMAQLGAMTVSETAMAGEYVALVVEDNGKGMSAEVQRRIFDPFFTTKFTGRGLGLSAVLGIVKAHSGALDLRSAEGSGTQFRIYLPTKANGAHAGPTVSVTNAGFAPKALPRLKGRILLVEDEAPVRQSCAVLLSRLGLEVEEAEDGMAALDLYGRGDDFDLVLMDITMPRMGGVEAARTLRERNPEAKIVLMTGYTVDETFLREERVWLAGFLPKPFELARLAELLSAAGLRA